MTKRLLISSLLVALTSQYSTTWAQDGEQPNTTAESILEQADASAVDPDVSPVRRIQRPPFDGNNTRPGNRPPSPIDEIRSIDGSGNNPNIPELNAAETNLARLTDSDYQDGISSLAGADRPSARAISNLVNAQEESHPNSRGTTDYLWQWGQFLDHDVDLTDGADPAEPMEIAVPAGDAFFDPDNNGDAVIGFNRSIWNPDSGTDTDNPRQQLNEISGWVDASNVYGSDEVRAEELRTLDGTGKLKTSDGNLLPFNEAGLPNAGGSSNELFLGGDVRANEQLGLTAMHTLFMREHNRLAEALAVEHPNWDGEQIYQQARVIVAGQIQVITYNEFLPALLGNNALSRYRGYRLDVDARLVNEFSTAAYRLGHSMLNGQILRLDADGNEIEAGHLALRDAFFRPDRLITEGGIDPMLRGLAKQRSQDIDVRIIDDVRNFLFGEPGEGGFDLASLNIQRGRDHGLPGYNDVREALGLPRVNNFNQISDSPEVRQRLRAAYDNVDQIDLWVGGLAEDHVRGAMVGRTFFSILKHQFEVLRDGDRFWYTRTLSRQQARALERTRLSDIIRRNTDIGNELQNNVFFMRGNPNSDNQ